ncbi:MAG: universal stress protein [Bacteroidota bacterium]
MNTLDKILIPMNFSDSAMNAFRYALNLIRADNRMQLILINVIERDEHGIEAVEAMNQFDTLKSAVPDYVERLEIIIKHGRLIDTIVETVAELDPSLVIMGTKGKSKSLMHSESNTSMLVRKLDRSVMVIPQHAEELQIDHIAVAVDDEIDHPADLLVVRSIAEWFGAKVHILTIQKPVAGLVSEFHQADTLEYYFEELDYQHAFAESEDVLQGIEQYIQQHHIDIPTILPKTHAQFGKPSAGQLTRVLTLQSKIPLLIVD